jgi:hypothetical protein
MTRIPIINSIIYLNISSSDHNLVATCPFVSILRSVPALASLWAIVDMLQLPFVSRVELTIQLAWMLRWNLFLMTLTYAAEQTPLKIFLLVSQLASLLFVLQQLVIWLPSCLFILLFFFFCLSNIFCSFFLRSLLSHNLQVFNYNQNVWLIIIN